jgi:hypothetical protein
MAVTRLTTNGLTGTKYDIASADNYFMEPIATNLLASSTASITFSNIPNTYKHLQIRWIGLTDDTGSSGLGNVRCSLFFNTDTTATNYYNHFLIGNGSAASAGSENSAKFAGNAVRNSMIAPGVNIVDILDYASTTKNKTVRTLTGFENNDTNGNVRFVSGSWTNTSPINSIQLTPESGNLKQYSRFSLYGIKG